MNFEERLNQVAERYRVQGYKVAVQPGPDELPEFAKDFKVEIIARREDGSALVSAKRTAVDLESDPNIAAYVEITEKQPEWRVDLIILAPVDQSIPKKQAAKELSDDEIRRTLRDVERMLQAGFAPQALMTAWAGLEAAMRRRLRAAGEDFGWGTSPHTILNILYSHGIVNTGAFQVLEAIFYTQNAIAHGFASPNVEPHSVTFLVNTARSLLDESPVTKMTA